MVVEEVLVHPRGNARGNLMRLLLCTLSRVSVTRHALFFAFAPSSFLPEIWQGFQAAKHLQYCTLMQNGRNCCKLVLTTVLSNTQKLIPPDSLEQVMRKRKRVRATTDHLSAQLSGACDGVEEFNHVSLDFQAKRRSEGRYRNQDRLAPATCTPPTRVEFETPRVRSSKAPSPGYIHHTTVEQFLQVYNSPFMPKRTYGRRQLKHRQITLAPAARLNSMITPIESPPLAKPYKMRRLPPKYNRKSSQIARGGTAPETSSAATKPTSRTKDIRRKTSTTTFNHRLAKAAISCDGDPLDTLVLPHNSGSALAQRRPLKFRPLDFSSAICRPSSSLEHVADTIPDPPFSKVCSSAANNGLTSSHIVGFKVPAGNSLVHVKRVGTQSRNAATFTSNRGGLRSKILQSNARQPLSFVSLLDSNNGINNGITHRKRCLPVVD